MVHRAYVVVATLIIFVLFIVLNASVILLLILGKYLLKLLSIPVDFVVYILLGMDKVKMFRKEVTREVNRILSEL